MEVNFLPLFRNPGEFYRCIFTFFMKGIDQKKRANLIPVKEDNTTTNQLINLFASLSSRKRKTCNQPTLRKPVI